MLTSKLLFFLQIGVYACLGHEQARRSDVVDGVDRKQHGGADYGDLTGKWNKKTRINDGYEDRERNGDYPYEKRYSKDSHHWREENFSHKESNRANYQKDKNYNLDDYDYQINKDHKKGQKRAMDANEPNYYVEKNRNYERRNNEYETNPSYGMQERQENYRADNKITANVEASEQIRENPKKVIIQHLPAFVGPPDPNNTELMARYILHKMDWAGLATVTTRGGTGPFSNVVSISDGTEDDGSGVPYFYLTPMDLSSQDISRDSRASIVCTLAQTEYCRNHALDSEDPRCARLILSGKIKRIRPDSPEEEFARNALFTRHPSMCSWPQDHGFYMAKLKIGQIILLDQFGGPKYVDVKDYLNPQPSSRN